MGTVAGCCIDRDNRLDFLAFVASDSALVYAEFVGPVALSKAIRALLRESMAEASRKRTGTLVYTDLYYQSYLVEGKSKIVLDCDGYYFNEKRVKAAGKRNQDHWCIMAHKLTKLALQRKYVIAGDLDQKSPWFIPALRDYTAPVHRSWYDHLWRKAIDSKLLLKLPVSLGVAGWELVEDKRWTADVQAWTKNHDLALPREEQA